MLGGVPACLLEKRDHNGVVGNPEGYRMTRDFAIWMNESHIFCFPSLPCNTILVRIWSKVKIFVELILGAARPDNVVVNYVFSGFYSSPITGLIKRFYYFSSPHYPPKSFQPPYGAFLKNNQSPWDASDAEYEINTAVATIINPSCLFGGIKELRTGILYSVKNTTLYGVCHGFAAPTGSNTVNDDATYYYGHNFYNAFYPMGYFSPPYGENFTINKASQGGYAVLGKGTNLPLNVTEYGELYGIPSMTTHDVTLTTDTLTADTYSPLYTPQEACPPDTIITNYYDEINFNQIPGTIQAIGGNNKYNGNPIPTSLDNYDIKVNGRYQISGDDSLPKNNYILVEYGNALPSYNVGNAQNKLNSFLCPAIEMEAHVRGGAGSNGVQLMGAPDALLQGDPGSQISTAGADPWNYWHFTFRENAEYLPFSNNFVQQAHATGTPTVRTRGVGEGTILFHPILSSEDQYWQNRQCPSAINFLPWTFGANIYACPSHHFDIPYYAAIRKFGFYGTRFLNSEVALHLKYPFYEVDYASELPLDSGSIQLPQGELEPADIDITPNSSFSQFDNLLAIANAEQQASLMYALNQGYFVWKNNSIIQSGAVFQTLSQIPNFIPAYSGMIQQFDYAASGISSSNRIIVSNNTAYSPSLIVHSGAYNNTFLTNDVYHNFLNKITNILGSQITGWNSIEKQFSYYVATTGGTIDTGFYYKMANESSQRIRTRYMENLVKGNPIDLFPLNSITFATDKAQDYIESPQWNKSVGGFSIDNLPEIPRRYFEGAYSNVGLASGLSDKLQSLADSQTDFYYPGFFQNLKVAKDSFMPRYSQVVSGKILDELGRSFSPSGWLAVGYHGVGGLDSNFSCFTPIFVQHPVPVTFCKIGQKPTFRTLAVDYHTIPEDKISRRYPEIMYWCEKLKLLDCQKNYLYPLSYVWYRAPKATYNSSIIAAGDLSQASPASRTAKSKAFNLTI
jgi:hypothetical protein